LGDFRSWIRIGVLERSVLDGVREKFVQGTKTAAGENEFPAYLRVTALHEAQQFDLLLGARREIEWPPSEGTT